MNKKQYFVYIATNKINTVLYTGVTNNLVRRIFEHKNQFVSSFTSKYKINKLVYYEVFDNIEEAIKREKQLKNWHRDWKINLIKSKNQTLKDLYQSLLN